MQGRNQVAICNLRIDRIILRNQAAGSHEKLLKGIRLSDATLTDKCFNHIRSNKILAIVQVLTISVQNEKIILPNRFNFFNLSYYVHSIKKIEKVAERKPLLSF